jgi:hypothetical protein
MTERQKDGLIRSWNLCDRRTKVRIAAEFFQIMRNNKRDRDWWQFLHKKLLTITGQDLYCDTESRTRSPY